MDQILIIPIYRLLYFIRFICSGGDTLKNVKQRSLISYSHTIYNLLYFYLMPHAYPCALKYLIALHLFTKITRNIKEIYYKMQHA